MVVATHPPYCICHTKIEQNRDLCLHAGHFLAFLGGGSPARLILPVSKWLVPLVKIPLSSFIKGDIALCPFFLGRMRETSPDFPEDDIG